MGITPHPAVPCLNIMRFLYLIAIIAIILAVCCDGQKRRRRRRTTRSNARRTTTSRTVKDHCHDDLQHCTFNDCKLWFSGCKKTCGVCDLGIKDDEPDIPEECKDTWSDDTCPIVAENNWCNEDSYKGKCCMSCKVAEDTKDPECHDVAQGCSYYKKRMCQYYPHECRKTCGLC